MQHSQSDVALGTKNGSWADIKHAEGLKKRSNTAQNLQFYGAFDVVCGGDVVVLQLCRMCLYGYADICVADGMHAVEEQKRLYQELPFMALPGMRRQSFQRERSFSNLKSRSSWGSFTNLVAVGSSSLQCPKR